MVPSTRRLASFLDGTAPILKTTSEIGSGSSAAFNSRETTCDSLSEKKLLIRKTNERGLYMTVINKILAPLKHLSLSFRLQDSFPAMNHFDDTCKRHQ